MAYYVINMNSIGPGAISLKGFRKKAGVVVKTWGYQYEKQKRWRIIVPKREVRLEAIRSAKVIRQDD